MDATTVAVRAVRSVGPDTVALDLATPEDFSALPGQFILVRATVDGEELARHYTLSSADVGETFEVTVGVDPEGDLSPWLADRQPGDTLSVEGPFGTVAYEHGSTEDVVVIAGGPGVGPAVGIAEAAMADGNRVSIVYEDDAPAHEDRLAALAAGGADVAVLTADGAEAEPDDGAESDDRAGSEPDDGSLADAVRTVADRGEVYVFGFRSFIDRVLPGLEAAGVDPDDANIESFG